jgi:hypothetical protein
VYGVGPARRAGTSATSTVGSNSGVSSRTTPPAPTTALTPVFAALSMGSPFSAERIAAIASAW